MSQTGQPKTLNIMFINSINMFGGGEVWMLRTLAALKQRGHRVQLMCRPRTKLAEETETLGIDLIPLDMRGDFDPLAIWCVFREIKRRCIDVVLTNQDKELRFGGIAARLAGVKAVVPRRGIDYPLKNRWRYRFAYNVLATSVIANSRATKKALLRNAPWLNPDRIRVIYNGIDPAPFSDWRPSPLRAELGIPEKAPLIGFVGQLDERKGIQYLLSAFQKLREDVPGARLLMVGEGALEGWIRETVNTHRLHDGVVLTGFREDIVSVMKAIDMLVLPSLWEGFGIVLIEAMAAAKPVVTTDVSNMPEIVEDGVTGALVPAGDADSLAEAMLQIAGDQKLARRMGQAGQKKVLEEFTLQSMIRNLEECFFDALRS